MKRAEEQTHKAICRYIKLQYRSVIFTSEQSGLKVPGYYANLLKATRAPERGLPDIWILEPSYEFHGLLLEVKNSPKDIFKRSGAWRETEHLKNQRMCIELLRSKGYCATFVTGVDHAMQVINAYLRHEPGLMDLLLPNKKQ